MIENGPQHHHRNRHAIVRYDRTELHARLAIGIERPNEITLKFRYCIYFKLYGSVYQKNSTKREGERERHTHTNRLIKKNILSTKETRATSCFLSGICNNFSSFGKVRAGGRAEWSGNIGWPTGERVCVFQQCTVTRTWKCETGLFQIANFRTEFYSDEKD